MSSMMSFNNAYSKVINEDSDVDNDSYELVFSSNLASEFTHTVNEFTGVCAKMVQQKNINKDLADKFDDLYSKIKNLVDAAKNSWFLFYK